MTYQEKYSELFLKYEKAGKVFENAAENRSIDQKEPGTSPRVLNISFALTT